MEQSITVDVAAPPERVWEVLSDVEYWSEWTSTVTLVRRLDEGPLRTGSRAKIRQPRIPETEYVVTELEPGRSFTWVATGPGVLTTARHDVEPLPGGGTSTTRPTDSRPCANSSDEGRLPVGDQLAAEGRRPCGRHLAFRRVAMHLWLPLIQRRSRRSAVRVASPWRVRSSQIVWRLRGVRVVVSTDKRDDTQRFGHGWRVVTWQVVRVDLRLGSCGPGTGSGCAASPSWRGCWGARRWGARRRRRHRPRSRPWRVHLRRRLHVRPASSPSSPIATVSTRSS